MICLDCKNKNICRHYPNFTSAMEIVQLTITHCERFVGTEESTIPPTPTKTPIASIDRMVTGYPDFSGGGKQKEPLEVFVGKNDAFTIKEPDYHIGVCQFCQEEKEVYTCACGTVCCEDCGMPPYCKNCWETI